MTTARAKVRSRKACCVVRVACRMGDVRDGGQAWIPMIQVMPRFESDCRLLPAVLLCFFLGFLGVHRFYVGKGGAGALYLDASRYANKSRVFAGLEAVFRQKKDGGAEGVRTPDLLNAIQVTCARPLG
jgi:hypothetical protein